LIAAAAWEVALLPMPTPVSDTDAFVAYAQLSVLAARLEQAALGAAMLFAVWAMREARVLAAALAMLSLKILETVPVVAMMADLAKRA